jgi:hypothetical protein
MGMSPASRLVLVAIGVATALTAIALSPPSDRGAPSALRVNIVGAPQGTATLIPSVAAATARNTLPTGSPNTVSTPTAYAPTGGSLGAVIATLPVAEEARSGYARDLFRLWIDEDGDGCDTRKEVLLAEALSPPDIGSGCRLSGGRWISAYDGISVGDASKLDIDHLVPLAEAWDSGAYGWTPGEREAYANDLGVPWALIAVTAASNRAKGDRDPAEWMPPLASYECTYLVDWVSVKVRWGLSVDEAERGALDDMASKDCASVPVPPILASGYSR